LERVKKYGKPLWRKGAFMDENKNVRVSVPLYINPEPGLVVPMSAKKALRKLFSLNKKSIGFVVFPISQFELARKIILHIIGRKCDIKTRTSKTRILIKLYY
jgi:hypothetical protein